LSRGASRSPIVIAAAAVVVIQSLLRQIHGPGHARYEADGATCGRLRDVGRWRRIAEERRGGVGRARSRRRGCRGCG